MLPGGRAAVKAGSAAIRAAGSIGAKAGRAVVRAVKRCNSFAPETSVLMADGSTRPINEVQVGDLVTARDPITGELSAQPVLGVIVGFGDKHLVGVTTSRAPPNASKALPSDASTTDTWIATANHPIWVDGKGWTDAENLHIGDLTVAATGDRRAVQNVVDYGWVSGQTVFNLSVANVHTFIVGAAGQGVLVHNCSLNTNSLGFTGRTHVYAIVQHGRRDLDYVYKYGKGSRLTKGGQSIRASSQVRRLNRNLAPGGGPYSYAILSHHRGTPAGPGRERALIAQWSRATGGRFLPRGNARAW
jgi:hypothetical protein